MSETGGPVFEGSANFTPPKKGIVEKMKQKISEVHLSETANNVRERVVDRLSQNSGTIVEKKWMDAYQKTVDALDEGKRKKVVEKLRPVAVGVAKLNRFGAAVNDVFLQLAGAGDVLWGGIRLLSPRSSLSMRLTGASQIGSGVGEAALGTKKISRVATGWMGDVAGIGGEKVAQITNKILRGKPKAESVVA